MRISDWSSDVCSSDLGLVALTHHRIRAVWFSIGTIYVTLPALALLAIRANPQYGEEMLFWTIAMVVAADTGGYLVGRTVGGPKLAPSITIGRASCRETGCQTG